MHEDTIRTMSSAFPALPSSIPRRGNAFTRTVARGLMRLTGWRFDGIFPDLPKMVVIVAPHTSNWDFFVGLMAMFALGFRGTFLGKHTLFRWPLGIVMRWLGGIPVDRGSPHNVVEQVTAHFASRTAMMLALSPEGTRKKLAAWRTGFYHVAVGAGVAIVPVAFDFPHRTIRFFAPFRPTGDQDGDIARLRTFYRADMAYHPSQY
jgi:1-acyl-sn-glycerol-3-phosphate acyltransferase